MTRKTLIIGGASGIGSTYLRPALAALVFIGLTGTAYSAQAEWVKPKQLIADNSLPQAKLKANETVAR